MTRYADVAVAFVSAVADGDFTRAHTMLAPPLRDQLTPDRLRELLYAMWRSYADGGPERIWFDEQFSGTERSGMIPGDIGWAYVGIESEDFTEAVTVIVTDVEGSFLVRDIEWGRP